MLESLKQKSHLERWRETPLRAILAENWISSEGKMQAIPKVSFPETMCVIPVINGKINPQWFDEKNLPNGVLIQNDPTISIKILKDHMIDEPIIILNHIDSYEEKIATKINVEIELEEQSKATIIFLETGGGCYLSLPKITLKTGKNAQLEWIKLSLNDHLANSLSDIHAYQYEESNATYLHYQSRGNLIRSDIHIELLEERAHAEFLALNLGTQKQHLANVMTLDHKVPNCTSKQNIKNLLTDKAMALFDGMIHVFQDAQKTDADQLTRSILLSDNARAMTIPRLEIYADDVRCTHGATIGFIEPESLFYLRSRGLDEKTAKGILMRAYAVEIIDNINNESLKLWLTAVLEEDLKVINE